MYGVRENNYFKRGRILYWVKPRWVDISFGAWEGYFYIWFNVGRDPLWRVLYGTT